MARSGPIAYTFEQTSARLDVYEAWLRVVTEAGGRELLEGPDAARAKPLTAPKPMATSRGHVVGHYSVQQIFDAYRICDMLRELVQQGNWLFSRSPGDPGLRREAALERQLLRLE